PRFVSPGQRDLLLRDVRAFTQHMIAFRDQLFRSTARCLAAAEATGQGEKLDVDTLAKKHGVEADALRSWLDYLGIGGVAMPKLSHFVNKLPRNASYDFVKGWGRPQTPSLVANSSDRHVRIPGNLKPHGVCVHPSPTLAAAVGWQSPIAGEIRIAAR